MEKSRSENGKNQIDQMPRLNYRKKLILNGLYFQYIIMYIFTVSN